MLRIFVHKCENPKSYVCYTSHINANTFNAVIVRTFCAQIQSTMYRYSLTLNYHCRSVNNNWQNFVVAMNAIVNERSNEPSKKSICKFVKLRASDAPDLLLIILSRVMHTSNNNNSTWE